MSTKKKIKFDLKLSYLAMIENSVGTKLFQNFYVRDKGKKVDATQGGKLSCALFVSFILNNFGLLKESHATVKNTVKDMKKNGWFKINRPRQGAVLLWERKKMGGEAHPHLGFYLGKDRAISNSHLQRTPRWHHWTYGRRGGKNYRAVQAIFWHKKLN